MLLLGNPSTSPPGTCRVLTNASSLSSAQNITEARLCLPISQMRKQIHFQQINGPGKPGT